MQLPFFIFFFLALSAALPAQNIPGPALNCVTAQTDRVDLEWTNATSGCGPFEATEVYRATEADGPYSLIAEITDPTATSFSDANPLGELRYYYLRYRYDCPAATAATSDTLDSFIPRTPVIRYVSLEDGELIIDWEESSSPEVIGYVVLEVLPTSFVPLDTIRSGTDFRFTPSGTTPAVERQFRIVAFDACGNLSPQSAILSAAGLAGTGGEGCTSRLTLTADQTSLARFQPLSRLELFVSTNDGPFVSAGTAPPTATEVRYDGANDGDELCFYLEGVLLGDEARARSEVYCQSVSITQPVRPFELYGVEISDNGTLDFRFQDDQLQPVPARAELIVTRSGNLQERSELPRPIFGNDGRLSFAPQSDLLESGTTYRFRLIDDCDREVETNAVAPVLLSVSGAVPGTNQVRWTELVNGLDGAVSYTLFRLDTAGNRVTVASDLTATSFTDREAGGGEVVCYRVEAVYQADTTAIFTTYSFRSNVACVRPVTEVFLPNVFSPVARSEANRVFRPFFSSPPPPEGYELRVYDRWGGLRFFTNDPTTGWDGTSGGQELRSGTFLYVLRYRSGSGQERRAAGTVNLIR